MLALPITKRWMMLGWLLNYCSHPLASANIKVCLFYDWLFYTKSTMSIMLIEPAALLMYKSMLKYITITEQLADFLLIWSENFDPVHKIQIMSNIRCAFLESQAIGILPLEQIYKSKVIKDGIRKRLIDFLEVSKYNVGVENKEEAPILQTPKIVEDSSKKIKVDVKLDVI